MKAQPGDFLVLYRPVKHSWPRPRPARTLAQEIKKMGREGLRVADYLEMQAESAVVAVPIVAKE